IRLHGMDLTDTAERLQVAGKLRSAHRDADAIAEPGKRAHHVSAEKSRSAVNRDERFQCNVGHDRSRKPTGSISHARRKRKLRLAEVCASPLRHCANDREVCLTGNVLSCAHAHLTTL